MWAHPVEPSGKKGDQPYEMAMITQRAEKIISAGTVCLRMPRELWKKPAKIPGICKRENTLLRLYSNRPELDPTRKTLNEGKNEDTV